MHHPIVSVILPNYNHSSFLEKRIESILNQTFSDFELIILDDNSTDNSRVILSCYKDHPKVTHCIYCETNSGNTFIQWNKGFALAKGKYIWLAESDDMSDPDFLRTCVNLLEQNKDATIAYTGSVLIDENDKVIQKDWDKFGRKCFFKPVEIISGGKFVVTHLYKNNRIYNASMVVFRKHCLDSIASDYLSFKYCGDWLFWVNIAAQGSVIKINKKLNYFRQHSQKVSPNAERQGIPFKEGPVILKYIESMYRVGWIRRYSRYGAFFKELERSTILTPELKIKSANELSKLTTKRRTAYFIHKVDNFIFHSITHPLEVLINYLFYV